MPREIFGEVANPAPRLGSRSWYTVPMSIAAHVAIAAVIVIVPLMATDTLPAPRAVIGAFTAQPAPPPPPPPPAAGPAVRSQKPMSVSASVAPQDAPSSIEPEPARETTTSTIGVPGGVPGGLPNGVVGSAGLVPDVPLPLPQPARPLPVGGNIKEPKKVRHVPPVYPTMAQQARVEGIVIIEATIGIDGHVKEARVLRSKPLLDQAALEAVKQWVFTPTMLNGVPVPVIMTVTVNFMLK